MIKTVISTIGVITLALILFGCSNDKEIELIEQINTETNNTVDELKNDISEITRLNKELREDLEQQSKELDQQQKLIKLLPQSWATAEQFLNAYIELDYDTMAELLTDNYSIEQEGIILTDNSTKTPYLALQSKSISYILNNFELNSDLSSDKILMNVSFYVDTEDNPSSGSVVFMNLTLEKIEEFWRITNIDL